VNVTKPFERTKKAIMCAQYNTWSHVNCLNMSDTTLKHYLDYPHIDWAYIESRQP